MTASGAVAYWLGHVCNISGVNEFRSLIGVGAVLKKMARRKKRFVETPEGRALVKEITELLQAYLQRKVKRRKKRKALH
jgi:hypothetical protein